ncbi:MAG: PfkB family carbohydrate kinase [Bacteroidia bacterium]|nr:PfkB family carbohydrate kinase [Bacteroidia bacterium]
MLTIIAPSPDHKRIYRVASLAAGTVHRASEVLAVASGKGVNAVRALGCIGAEVKLVTPAGQAFHDALLQDASLEGAQLEVIKVALPTRCCVTLLSEDGMATEIVQEAAPMSEDEAAQFVAHSLAAVNKASALLLAGSIPSGVPGDLYEQCGRLASERGIYAVVDAHGVALQSALRGGPSVVKITRSELADTLELRREDLDVPSACSALRGLGARHIVLTDGGGPVTIVEEDGTVFSLAPETVKVVNAVGSGDAMSAGITLALGRGQDLRHAIELGMRMGSANAATLIPGELPVDFTEITSPE